jgi:hypothetical protein
LRSFRTFLLDLPLDLGFQLCNVGTDRQRRPFISVSKETPVYHSAMDCFQEFISTETCSPTRSLPMSLHVKIWILTAIIIPTYHLLQHTKILHSAHRVYLCISYFF